MPRRRPIACPKKQAQIREEIRQFGPVKYCVRLLKKRNWRELEEYQTEDKDGNEVTKERIIDRTNEYSQRLFYAMRFVDKVAPNLRHSTTEVYDEGATKVTDASTEDLLREVGKREGLDPGGKGAGSTH